MIRRIQALRYRCLRYVDLDLDRFHVLIGPNASGKSTLFDAVAFLGDLVRDGLESAVESRTRNLQDMVWNRPGSGPSFELAVEFDIPERLQERLPEDGGYRRFRGLAKSAAGATDVVRGTDHPYFLLDCGSRGRRAFEILFSSGLAG